MRTLISLFLSFLSWLFLLGIAVFLFQLVKTLAHDLASPHYGRDLTWNAEMMGILWIAFLFGGLEIVQGILRSCERQKK